MKTLIDAARASLEAAGLLHSEVRILCAVSGGADSVALLHALSRLRGETGYALEAVHVQHGLRGADSEADEAFVRQLAETLEIRLYVEQAGLKGSMDDPGMETRARDCRRRIFAELMQKTQADALMLAHHRDDQTETVLMRLLRGAGAEGLRGMQPAAPFAGGLVLRPFLTIPKQHLLDALAQEGLSHREDQSNFEAVTPRNALRLTVLPQLERLFPGAGAHVAEAAETLSADERLLAAQADALYTGALYSREALFMLDGEQLSAAPEALLRRCVRRWYAEALAIAGETPDERSLSRADTLSLCRLVQAEAGGKLNLPCGLMAAKGERFAHILRQSGEPLRKTEACEIPLCAQTSQYDLPHVQILRQEACQALPATSLEAAVAPEILARKPVFRTPRPGDIIRPMGASGSKPLRRFLTDRKVDPCLRASLCVLAAGDEILWIPSIVTAEALRVRGAQGGLVRLSATVLYHQPKE